MCQPLGAQLGARHHTLAPDLPGFGDSDKPAGTLGIDKLGATLAEWVRAVGLRPAVLVGTRSPARSPPPSTTRPRKAAPHRPPGARLPGDARPAAVPRLGRRPRAPPQFVANVDSATAMVMSTARLLRGDLPALGQSPAMKGPGWRAREYPLDFAHYARYDEAVREQIPARYPPAHLSLEDLDAFLAEHGDRCRMMLNDIQPERR